MKDALSRIRPLRPSTLGFLLFLVASSLRAQPFDLSGKMQHTDLEGGCWYLQANDGKQYELFGDQETVTPLHKQGAIVDLRVEPVKNGASTCMVGEIVRVLEVKNVRMQPYDPPVTKIKLVGTVKRTKSGVWYVQSKHGTRYEFQTPPIKKYRRVGAKYRATVTVNGDPHLSKEHMDGVIVPPTPPHEKPAPGKQYDSK